MAERSPSIATRRMNEIREDGITVPLAPDELEQTALETLPPAVADYLRAAAGSEHNVQTNREGFDRWRIVPRVFRDVTDRSLEVELFDRTLPAPLLVAPIGGQTMYHDEGELATARAASALNVPFTLSTVGSQSIEAVAEATGDAPSLFQLYWTADWDLTRRLLERAETSGYDGIVLTVDFQAPRWVPRTLRNAGESSVSAPKANIATDPESDPDEGGPFESDRSVTWDDLGFVREHTDLPVYVKGILHPDDAERAVEAGADGVVVSNHGGRQLDGAVGAITALPRVVAAVDGAVPVLFDSGVRTGADVFTALALGADAVFLGRPTVYGLAIAGERGVYEVLHNVLAGLDSVVGQAGYRSVAAVNEDALVESSG